MMLVDGFAGDVGQHDVTGRLDGGTAQDRELADGRIAGNTASTTSSVRSAGVVIRRCSMAASASDVDDRAAGRVGLGSAEDLVGQRRHVALAGEEEPQGVLPGSLLGPLEVDVRRHVVLGR